MNGLLDRIADLPPMPFAVVVCALAWGLMGLAAALLAALFGLLEV